MSTIGIIIIALLIVAVLALYISKREQQRSADRQDADRRAQIATLEDKSKSQLATLRAIAQAVQDKPQDHPIRVLCRNHVWEPGLSYWQEKSE